MQLADKYFNTLFPQSPVDSPGTWSWSGQELNMFPCNIYSLKRARDTEMRRFQGGAAAKRDPCPFTDARFNDTSPPARF